MSKLWILCTCLIFVSCFDNSSSNVTTEESYEYKEEIDTFLIKARKEAKLRMIEKSFNFICLDNCEPDPYYHGPTQDTIDKYGIRKPPRCRTNPFVWQCSKEEVAFEDKLAGCSIRKNFYLFFLSYVAQM